jgi:integrase/recombinase XerD
MGQALRVIAETMSGGKATPETFPWSEIRYQHSQRLRSILSEHYAPAAANKILSALRGVLHECFRLELMSAEDHARATDIEGIKGSSPVRGRALKTGELVALFEACDATTAQGSRDAALLGVLYGVGLRRAEVVALAMKDYDSETGSLRIENGKGQKARTVYITNGAKEALAAWLEVRGSAPGALFLAVDKAGEVRPGAMSGQAVYAILKRLQGDAKVKTFSPHDARRTFITNMLANGNPIDVVQQLAGHANVNTTARYSRSGEDAKKKAAETLFVPFAG